MHAIHELRILVRLRHHVKSSCHGIDHWSRNDAHLRPLRAPAAALQFDGNRGSTVDQEAGMPQRSRGCPRSGIGVKSIDAVVHGRDVHDVMNPSAWNRDLRKVKRLPNDCAIHWLRVERPECLAGHVERSEYRFIRIRAVARIIVMPCGHRRLRPGGSHADKQEKYGTSTDCARAQAGSDHYKSLPKLLEPTVAETPAEHAFCAGGMATAVEPGYDEAYGRLRTESNSLAFP